MTRLVRIAKSVFGCILLLGVVAGCTKTDEPALHGTITFRAEPVLLRDGTKAGTLKDATFRTNDSFKVFGRRDTEHDGHQLLFNDGAGSVVTKQSSGVWTYSPVELWNWTGTQSDHYEFVGIYPVNDPATDTPIDSRVLTDYPGNIAVSTTYDISAGDNYDLMAATWFRDGRESSVLLKPVPMTFHHMTSAVNVFFENNSNAKKVRINSVMFKYITVSGNAFVTLTEENDPVMDWIDIEKSMSDTGASTVIPDAEHRDIVPRGTPLEKGWDLMIPQPLDQAPAHLNPENYLPRLCVSYTPFDGDEPGLEDTTEYDEIVLKDICRSERDGGEPITAWEAGKKYVYYISMRLDGGLLVELVTVDWDYVPAHTWGLLI